jgi:hypothetical protein
MRTDRLPVNQAPSRSRWQPLRQVHINDFMKELQGVGRTVKLHPDEDSFTMHLFLLLVILCALGLIAGYALIWLSLHLHGVSL